MGIFIPGKENKPSVDQIDPSQHSQIDTKKNFDDKLLKRAYVEDTFTNQTALNMNRMSPIIKQLKNFPSGSTIKVTYFSQTHNFTDKQSNRVDYSYLLNNVHKCCAKILNLEIKLDGDMTYEYDQDSGQSTCEGTGKIFSGLTPHAGDIFLYEISTTGQLGLFLVTDNVPLAIHQASHHTTSFVLKQFVDNATIQKLEECVIETYHFTRQEIFGSSYAILKRSDYYDLVKCATTRMEMINLYKELFYDRNTYTIVRRDGIYDGYMVQFMNRLISSSDLNEYPFVQLLHEAIYSKPCIWTIMLENKKFAFTAANKYDIEVCQYNTLAGFINSLHNQEFIHLNKEGEFYYGGFTQNFYDKVVAQYTPYEALVANFMSSKVVDLPSLFTLIDEIGTLTDEGMFYQIPVYIFLCNAALSSF